MTTFGRIPREMHFFTIINHARLTIDVAGITADFPPTPHPLVGYRRFRRERCANQPPATIRVLTSHILDNPRLVQYTNLISMGHNTSARIEQVSYCALMTQSRLGEFTTVKYAYWRCLHAGVRVDQKSVHVGL